MTKKIVHVLLTFLLLVFFTPVGNAAMTEKDSAIFDWTYEMDVMPHEEDLDENLLPDFTIVDLSDGSSSSSVSNGILTINSPSSSASYWIASETSGTVWPGNFTAADGYTVEARVKVVSDLGSSRGPFSLYINPTDDNGHTFFNVKGDAQSWGVTGGNNLGTADNTTDYHVFRVASTTNNTLFQVWRDGVLVGENLTPAGNWSGDYFDFGDIGGGNMGECLVDYVRFTPGAYAPVGGEQPSLPPVKPERPGPVAGGPVIDGGTTPYAWYRADQGVVPYINAPEQVAWWTDQSGNSRHVEAFGDPETTTDGVEGRTVIHFDEVGDMMQSTVEDWGEAEAGTIFAVWRRTSLPTWNAPTLYDSAEDNPHQYMVLHPKSEPATIEVGGTTFADPDWISHGNTTEDTVGQDAWALTSVSHTTGLTDTIRINGQEAFSGDLLSDGMHGLTIGCSANSGVNQHWVGDIAELIIFEGELSGTEREAIELALMDRWGLSSTLPGDLNGDGFVGGDDLDIVRSFWGQSVETGNLLQGDPSEDGFVGGDDLDIVRANWGQGVPPTPSAVPEPNAATLFLILSGLALFVRRLRERP